MKDPAWTRQRFPAGARVVLRMTHDSDLSETPAVWVYPEGDGDSAVQLDAADVALTGARTYQVQVPETVTPDYVDAVMVVEVWLASSFEPIARGELEFYDGGGP